MTDDRDTTERDVQIHGALDLYARKIQRTFGLSWRDTLERMVAFAENDEEASVRYQPPALVRRKRRARTEAHV